MRTSFLSFSNMAGIVCASNQDHTIYQLSRTEPVAVAVDPHSPIPWDKIINKYKQMGEPQIHNDFGDYAKDFEKILSTFNLSQGTKKLSKDDANIIFLGFGKDDIFPSVFDVYVKCNTVTGELVFGDFSYGKISHKTPVFRNYLGNFENLETLFYGITRDTESYLIEKQQEMFRVFSASVVDKFKGTKYETAVEKKLNAFDYQNNIKECFDRAKSKAITKAAIGIDSFSIEDMVNAVETLVDSNTNLVHLRDESLGELGRTRELAVITRTEGLTWIKHSLYTF